MGDNNPPPFSPQMTPDQFMGFISSMTPEQRYMCQTYWDSGSATPTSTPATATPGPSAPQTADPTPLGTPIPTPYIGSPAPSRPPIGSPAPSGSTPDTQRRLGTTHTQRCRSHGGGCCGGSGGTDASTPPRQRPSISSVESTSMGSPRTPWGRTQGPNRSKV